MPAVLEGLLGIQSCDWESAVAAWPIRQLAFSHPHMLSLKRFGHGSIFSSERFSDDAECGDLGAVELARVRDEEVWSQRSRPSRLRAEQAREKSPFPPQEEQSSTGSALPETTAVEVGGRKRLALQQAICISSSPLHCTWAVPEYHTELEGPSLQMCCPCVVAQLFGSPL